MTSRPNTGRTTTRLAFILSFLCTAILQTTPCCGQTNPVILHMKSKTVSLLGKHLHNDRNVHGIESVDECVNACLDRKNEHPACLASYYRASEKRCDIFSRWAHLSASTLHVQMLQVRGVFHPISVKGIVYSIYLSQTVSYTFPEGREHCQALGGKLLEFDSLDEYEALRMVWNGQWDTYLWVGANDHEVDGHWVTDSDGKPLNSSLWSWAPEHPIGIRWDRQAASLNYAFEIHDFNFRTPMGVLCERNGW